MYASMMQQGRGFMWYGDGHMVGMHWAWWIFCLVVVGFLIWLVARTTMGASAGTPPPPRAQTPEEILRERFAKGEITEEEFRNRLRALKDSEG